MMPTYMLIHAYSYQGWRTTHIFLKNVKMQLTIESDWGCKFEKNNILVISFSVIVLIDYYLLNKVRSRQIVQGHRSTVYSPVLRG